MVLNPNLELWTPGKPPKWIDEDSIIVIEGSTFLDQDRRGIIRVPPGQSFLVSMLGFGGVNEIDDGVRTAGAWYYFYMLKNLKTNHVFGMFSTVNESVSGSITLPDGSNYYKAQTSLVVRNDASNNIIPFTVGNGWPFSPKILYTDFESTLNSTQYRVLNNGTAHTWTDVDLSSLVPPPSNIANLCALAAYNNANARAFCRPNGSSGAGQHIARTNVDSTRSNLYCEVITDDNQIIEYEWEVNTTNALTLHIQGFTVNGIAA